MIRRILLFSLIAAVGTGILLFFHHHRTPATIHLGTGNPVELPLGALLLIAVAVGAGTVLLIDILRSLGRSFSRAGSRRRRKRARAVDKIRQEGHGHLWHGDFKTAGKKLARAANREPQDLATQLALADSHVELGDLETAQRILEKTRAAHGPDPKLLSHIGNLALARGNAGAAIDALREATAALPESTRLLDELVNALSAGGQFEEAIEAARKRLNLERDSERRQEAKRKWIVLRYRWAVAEGTNKESNTTLKQLTQEEPSFLPAVMERAARARAEGDVRAAERLYRDSLQRNPTGAVLEQLRAITTGSKETKRAIGLLQEISKKSGAAGIQLALARMLVRAEQVDDADAILAELARQSTAKERAGVDIAPERDLVAGEIALARGNDREAARVLLRAASGQRTPFSYVCRSCGRSEAEWRPACECGSYGSLDWSVNGAEKESMQRGQAG